MKLFIASICCLAIIITVTAVGTVASMRIIDDILVTLHRAPTDAGRIPPEAKEISRSVMQMWEDDFFIISMFHPHQHLDEVKEKMVILKSYSDTDEYAEWKQAHESLAEALDHLKGLLKANTDNIM